MSYTTMKEMVKDAQTRGYAVGAFNIVDYVTTAAVIKAAEISRSPLIIQTSTKTIALYGYEPIVGWVKTLAEKAAVPIALHLDHCKDLDMIKNCIEAGWSSVMIDASSFPLEENIEMTKQVVKMARIRGVSVEGELGAIVGVEDELFVAEHDAHLADPDTCVQYIEATDIDILAPAIGTAHGIYHKEPHIDFNLIRDIADKTGMPLAIHGGTGLTSEVFKGCIEAGGAKVNISTSIKHIFRKSLEGYYQQHPTDFEPVRAIKHLENAVIDEAVSFMNIFGSAGRA